MREQTEKVHLSNFLQKMAKLAALRACWGSRKGCNVEEGGTGLREDEADKLGRDA